MTKDKSHIGEEIEGLKYYPVLDGGCGACLDEPNGESIEYKDDKNCVVDENGKRLNNGKKNTQDVSKLDEVVSRLGGENSQSGTVVMAMSGGVDSSVLPAILTRLGYKGIGVHMQFWVDPHSVSEGELADANKVRSNHLEKVNKFPENKCCSLESLEHAREIAHKYDMPFYVLNTRDVFKQKIVDYFIDEFAEGVTPNPCVECNRSIKFGYLIEKMRELGADFLATGHYVKNELVTDEDGDTHFALKMATDKLKDQSYFLYTITQNNLKHCIFPLADLNKDEIREIAEEEGLMKVAKKKDSQGICFFPEKSHVPFLKRHMKPEVNGANILGPMLTKDGEEKGVHEGLAFYTIGQRCGLEIGGPGGPWYVIGKDAKKNALIVGANEDLFAKEVNAIKLTFVADKIPKAALTDAGMPILARLRHRFTPNDAILKVNNSNELATATIIYVDPQRAVTPGQSVVFYKGDEVLGGGIIV
ncbi:MAG: tRNA 2-thiouridine(34) synthase MnmA [Candidatus Peregrinibacteria bacterium]|nr:tRNA 2-thiouridine(34) synthase MnmA [Candidatus Peregrinibacteria bacterium]